MTASRYSSPTRSRAPGLRRAHACSRATVSKTGTQPCRAAEQVSAACSARVRATVTRQPRVTVAELAGVAVASGQPDGVEPVLAEVSAQRDLGVLDGHRDGRAPAEPGEVEAARPRAGRPGRATDSGSTWP